MEIPRIVITGGPCAGKTTGLAYISEKLADRGFYPLIVPEVPTLLMLGNATPKAYSEEVFQRGVVKLMHEMEEVWDGIGRSRPELNPVLVCDRGIPDCPPYMRPDTYEGILRDLTLGSATEVRDRRYKGAIHLRSVAYDKPELYTTANNAARRENVDEARSRDEQTLAAWVGHPHLRVVDNSTDFEGKLHRLDQELCSILGIPVPLEIENKYRCAPVRFEDIPQPCQRIEIEQHYLLGQKGGRIRKRGQHDSFVYFRTQKVDVRPGVRIETEDFITAEEYRVSLRFTEKGLRKERWCFVWENQYFELDLIPQKGGLLYLLELELTQEQQRVRLPPFLTIEAEVSHDPAYSNYHLAEAA